MNQVTVAKVSLVERREGWNFYDVTLTDGSVRKIDGWSLRAGDAAAWIGDALRKAHVNNPHPVEVNRG